MGSKNKRHGTLGRRAVLGGGIAAGSTLALPAIATAASYRTLKIAHQFPAYTDFRDVLARKFAAAVERQSNGSLRFRIYPGASLYKPYQQFDAMASGALDMAIYPLAYSGGKLPATNLTLMPALIESYKQAYGWEGTPINTWLVDYLRDHGVEVVTRIWQAGGCASRSKAILLPGDVQGLKTRGGGRMVGLMLQAAGASIVPSPSTETCNAMRSGTVDALWTSSASLMSFRSQEVAKGVTTARKYTFWYTFEPLLISRSTFGKLAPSERRIVLDVGHSLQSYALSACKADDAKVAVIFGKTGARVQDMDKQQLLAWKKLARQSAWKDFSQHVRGGQKLIDLAEAVA